MTARVVILLGLAWGMTALGAPIDEGYAARLSRAIYAAEGGKRAKSPYGVLSVPTRSEEHARRVCLNSIRRGWDRWEADGRPGDFLEHFGARYCPTKGALTDNERRLNRNWIKNVRYFLKTLP